MMNKTLYTYKGMNQDTSKSKRGVEYYFDANNIRIVATDADTNGSVTTERGNVEVLSLKVGQIIIGDATINDNIILFSTDNAGDDNITLVDSSTYTKTTIYSANLNFNSDRLIEAVGNYENENIQKVYWVDGVNQLRFINTVNPPDNLNPELLDVVPSYVIDQPELEYISYGGIHTSGKIQYAYSLLRQYGQQTAISPFSSLIPLAKKKGGGEVNELVGQINNIIINNVDTKFDIIRVYAIKYTSYNQTPTASLIAEENIGGISTFRYSDDGSIIYNTSLEELLFSGGTPIIPSTIMTKKNRLILGNITEKYFDINQDLVPGDSNYFDTRAYRFPASSAKTFIQNLQDTPVVDGNGNNLLLDSGQFKIDTGSEYIYPEKEHDCINTNFNPQGEDELVISQGSLLSTHAGVDVPVSTIDRYYFDFLLESLTKSKYYIELSFVGNSYVKTKTFLITEEQSLDLRTTISNLMGSSYFKVGTYKPGSYIDSSTGKLIYYITNGTAYLPLTASYCKIYSAVTTTATNGKPYLYKRNSTVYGATGDNITVTVDQTTTKTSYNLLKSDEVYRLGIEFYNKYGQISQPHWITDIKIPRGNLKDNDHNILKIDITNKDKLISQGVVGYNILRVERTDQNKTIISQGIVNGGIFQETSNTLESDLAYPGGEIRIDKGRDYADKDLVKFPSPFMRNYKDLISNPAEITAEGDYKFSDSPLINRLQHGRPICVPPVILPSAEWPYAELLRALGNDSNHNSYEETRLFQFYSPETLFLNPILGENLTFKVIANVTNDLSDCAIWAKQYATSTTAYTKEKSGWFNDISITIDRGQILNDVKTTQDFHLFNASKDRNDIDGNAEFHQNGLIGPAGGATHRMNMYHYYRNYTIADYMAGNAFKIKGNPEVVGNGESSVRYGELTKFTFNNNLFSIVTDLNENEPEIAEYPIISVNSTGNTCINLVEVNELPLEEILASSGISEGTGIIEIIRTLANQYGGNTYEARSRNTYLRIGKYTDINASGTITIEDAGDIFVNNFKFSRVIPNIAQVENHKYTNLTEIVEFPVESSINSDYRNDGSVYGWDNAFQPSYDDYHSYNRVYSQEPIFNTTTANPFTFEPVKQFYNRINTTKVKTNGETIDSWTDVLVNEEIYLDGRYGKLVKLINNKNKDLAFQEKAIAQLQIQPRIQQVTNDGIGVELGTGQVLYNYEYVTTESGSVNKRAIFTSPSSIYYLDLANKSINRLGGNGLEGLSDVHGMHSFFHNLDYENLRHSDTVHGIFDNINNDAYFTVKDDFTISFNEFSNSFTSFYGFSDCNMYIKSNTSLYSSNDANKLWKHYEGDYCSFYGESPQNSSITLLCAPNTHNESLFYNLELFTELTKNGEDIFYNDGVYTVPIESVKIWNDYQDSGTKPLIYKSNIFRRFRNWGIQLPKDQTNKYDFIRGKWAKIELNISNTNNNKLILHDTLLLHNDMNPIR